MPGKKGLLLMGLGVILAVCAGAQAEAIALVNAGFEDTPSDPTKLLPSDGDGLNGYVEGWQLIGSGDATGTQNPSSSQIAGEAHGGTYTVFCNQASWGGAGPVQQITSAAWQGNTTYTLTAYVAHRNDVQLGWGDGTPGHAEIQLWDVDAEEDVCVASTSYDLTAVGAWELVTLQFTTPAAADYLGHNVAVRFNTLYGSVQLLFDDVSLDAVPEPATMSLLAVGGLGVLLRRKR